MTRIQEWIDNPNPEAKRILLLSGDKGAGKSALAHTVSARYNDLRRLGSSIFVSSGNEAAETRLPLRFFPTMAQDLAALDMRYRRKLWEGINADRALRNALDPADQFNHFILAPFAGLVLAGPIVFVIDGVENCSDLGSLGQFLAVLADRVHELPSNVRLLLTTTPNSKVSEQFVNHPHAQIEHLDGPGVFSIPSDLLRFAKFRLSTSRRGDTFEPRDVDCLELVKRSHGSFQRMTSLCDSVCAGHSESDFLERFWTTVLRQAPEYSLVMHTLPEDGHYYRDLVRLFDPQDSILLACFRKIIGSLVIAYRPLSAFDLVQFEDRNSFEAEEIFACVRKMHPFLMNAMYHYAPLTPFYPSFFDFLQDPQRSRQFFVDAADYHHLLAHACLQVLNEQLRFNICRLTSCSVRNDAVLDLVDRIEQFISTELSYAAQFWIDHLCASSHTVSEETDTEVETLLQTRLFAWLEVLSLLGRVDYAINALDRVTCRSGIAVCLRLLLSRMPLMFYSFILRQRRLASYIPSKPKSRRAPCVSTPSPCDFGLPIKASIFGHIPNFLSMSYPLSRYEHG